KRDIQRTKEARGLGELSDKRSFYAQDGTVRLKGADWRLQVTRCFLRDQFLCRKCGRYVGEGNGDPHHLKPRGKGGSDDLSNLETRCNRWFGDCHTSEHPQTQWTK